MICMESVLGKKLEGHATINRNLQVGAGDGSRIPELAADNYELGLMAGAATVLAHAIPILSEHAAPFSPELHLLNEFRRALAELQGDGEAVA